MAVWSVVSAGMNAVACLLNASEEITAQAICGTLTAACNVALSIVLARYYGITGVIAATVLSYLVFAVVPLSIETGRFLRRAARQATSEA
jgi:O-antigen/teichoic acid export membrane protein